MATIARGHDERPRHRIHPGTLTAAIVLGGTLLSSCTPIGPRPPTTASPSVDLPATAAPAPDPAAPDPAAPGPAATEPVTSAPTMTNTASVGLSPTAGGRASVLVYFQVEGPDGPRLVREPHQVTARTPARGTTEAMIAGPDDPDYTSPWNRDTRVLGVSDRAGVITVDLSYEARRANVGSAGAAMMKQQLIYNVTERLGAGKRVMLHIDGEPAGELWGAVDWSTPERRADWSSTLLLVGIDTPGHGATVKSPVRITGQAAAFEATVPWRVRASDEAVVQEGFAMTEEGNTLSPYRFDVTLPAGTYTVEVREDDPSDGEAGPPDVDTRVITVTP